VLMRLIFKILLKACIPIVCMVGIMSYGMYMRGGDPGAYLGKMLGNSIESAKNSAKNAGASLQSAAPGKANSNKTTVYKWVNESGVTQFGSTPPDGIAATSMTLKNNTNVVQSRKVEQPKTASNGGARQTGDQQGLGPDGKPLPGVAGMNLPVAVDPAVLSEFLQSMQQQ